ncbi:HutD family protein [Chitinimonas arctica]|uniref:HutD family protein n=1 Tax=Chitinimonas arctica TaxID=2594795 RepID=A0A516SF69_9NEIS|nr:HutD family protein [Chitinimonas arctica]QDQ26750.1 HutD family protein [Chitinimonas arctica]
MPHLFTPADYRNMPWRNGGGTTCELFRLSHPARPDDFALRLSIADVAQGGPFSLFPGVDRSLMLLEGAGMLLDFGTHTVRMDRPCQPIDFPGEAAVDCRLLDGPLRDFNLMVARDWGQAALRVLALAEGAELALSGCQWTLVHALAGQLRLGGRLIEAGQLLLLQDEAVSLRAGPASRVVVVEAGATV